MESSDAQLLLEYATTGSQGDFCDLERRYSGMVYGTAMRSAGCHQLAAITQDVFLLLARKAKTLQPAVLGAWLHRATVLKARERLRAEGGLYHRRVQAYAALNAHPSGNGEAALERLDNPGSTLQHPTGRLFFCVISRD